MELSRNFAGTMISCGVPKFSDLVILFKYILSSTICKYLIILLFNLFWGTSPGILRPYCITNCGSHTNLLYDTFNLARMKALRILIIY